MKKHLQAPRTKALNSILSLFLLLLLASCATYESHNTIICSDPAAGPSANPSNTASCSKPSTTPTTHMWQYLDSYQFEKTDYATYSYILVGRDTSNLKSTYLYQELIKSIQGSSINAEMFGTEIPTLYTNLFLIPVTPEDENGNRAPNYELSKLLLASLSASSSVKTTRPGPFIITLQRPITEYRENEQTDILYIDLTDAHPKAIPEIVRAYSEDLLYSDFEGTKNLESLHSALLNTALHAEDSIGFAKSAFASLKSAFSN